MIYLHLLWEVFLKHRFLISPVKYELDCCLCLNFDSRFPVLGVVEPSLGPPPQSGSVRIDSKQPGYVEALYLNVEIFKWVYYSG